MPDTPLRREQYVHRVLETYQRTPGTSGQVRPPDRQLALQLQQRAIPLRTVENAFVLGAARRIFRPAEAPPLTTVRQDFDEVGGQGVRALLGLIESGGDDGLVGASVRPELVVRSSTAAPA